MMASPWKNMENEVREVQALGDDVEVVLDKSNHLRVTYKGQFVGRLPGTPGDWRSGRIAVGRIKHRIQLINQNGVTFHKRVAKGTT